MTDVFLSYSRDDQPIARRFAEGLKAEGISVWWDQALSAGEAFDRVTEKALAESTAVVVLWSKHSVESDWVRAEATEARASGRLVPVTIEPCKRPIMFELTHTADLSGWSGDVTDSRWRAFIEGLKRQLGRDSSGFASPTPASPSTSARKRYGVIAAIAAAVLAAAGIAWFLRSGNAPATSSSATAVDASIAVLPLENLSTDPEQEHFADGLTEEILNVLAGISGLQVTARTSSFYFKGKKESLKTIGETLKVAHLLEGSVRRSGDQLRVTVQMVKADSGFHLWSKTYDRPFADIFAVQEDIARSVAESLQVSLGVGQFAGNRIGMTRNVDAYDQFISAQSLVEQFDADSQRRAIGLLEQSVERDPSFGAAWVFLARAYLGMVPLTRDDPRVWQEKSDVAYGRLEKLSGDAPELHLVLGERDALVGRWAGAGEHFEAAATKGAKLPWNGRPADERGFGAFMVIVGRVQEGRAMLEEEKARDPLNQGAAIYLVHAYGDTGNLPAAFAEADRGEKLGAQGLPVLRASALTQALGTRDKDQIRRRLNVGIAGINLGHCDQDLLDRPAQSLECFRRLVADPSSTGVTFIAAPLYLAYLGDPQTALVSLRHAAQRGFAPAAGINMWAPVLRDARQLPEFKALVRDLGYVDYWRRFGWGDFCKPVGSDDFECN